MQNSIFKNALVNSLLTAAYISCVATFMFYTPQIFANSPQKSPLIPIMLLLLLVFSAGLTGMLVFGKPVMWFLDGKKKEAVSLVFSTLGMLLVLAIIAAIALVLSR
jgi:hypothetical protein